MCGEKNPLFLIIPLSGCHAQKAYGLFGFPYKANADLRYNHVTNSPLISYLPIDGIACLE